MLFLRVTILIQVQQHARKYSSRVMIRRNRDLLSWNIKRRMELITENLSKRLKTWSKSMLPQL